MGDREYTRSTFPIPPNVVLARKLRAVGESPVTWGGVAASLGAIAMLPNVLGVLLAGGLLAGLGSFWKQRMPGIETEILEDLIEESNEAQDSALSKAARKLHKYKCYDYAETLTRFMAVKKEIEQGIHSTPEVTKAEEDVEKLVDALCFEVTDDLFKMADIRYTLKKRRKRLSQEKVVAMKESQDQLGERVAHAYDTLREAQKHLHGIVGPMKKPDHDLGANPVLDETIAQLKEEAMIAKRVRERIEADMGADLESSETTYAASRGMVES